MIPEQFTFIGIIIASIAGLTYLIDTIRGRAQPNRVTWGLWSLFSMIAFASQISQGVGIIAYATLVASVLPVSVFTASFFIKSAYWRTRPLDYICLAIALLGAVLWVKTDVANYALVFAILADLAAGLPTLIKSIKHPETESWRAYAIDIAGYGIMLLAVQVWTFENYSFVLYLTIMSTLFTVFSFRGRPKQSRV